MWADYEELYSADFTSGNGYSYTQNKALTISSKDWTVSSCQLNGSVFYLGCSSSTTDYAVLNNNATFSTEVTALCTADATYNTNKTTAHAYAMKFANAYNNVTKVEFNWAGGNTKCLVYLFGDSGSGYVLLQTTNYSTSGTSTAGSVVWTGNATNYTKFAIVARPYGNTTSDVVTANKTLRPTTFKIYKTVSVASPTFTVAEGTYTSAQNVGIECTTDGATIYYTMGDNPADPTDASTPYNGAIEVNATTTIKAIAKKGSDYSAVSSATYTILTPTTISAARTQGTGDVYTQGIVTSVNGKTAYIQDNTAAIAVYNSAANLTVAVGNNIKVQGTLETSHGLLRITTPTIEVESSGNAVSPAIKTISEINTDYSGENALQGKLVTIENATVTNINGSNYTIAQSQNTLLVYGYMNVAVNDIITLKGNIGCYDAVQIVNPTNITKHNPVINANNVTLACDATSGEISYTIDNPSGADLSAVLTEGDWISNIAVTSTKVTFTTTANGGDANRTATITLSYKGAADKAVTVTQLYQVNPTSLPFNWTGGASSALTALTGVIANGLGSDYGDTNAPYLIKFDNTDDNIQIYTDEKPVKVTLGVKMIGGSNASKITVQESANGVDFTDVQELTISGSQYDIVNLATTEPFKDATRVVRLLFTKGSNVGVGPISIFSEGDIPVTVTSAGWASFSNASAVDFTGTGITAYIAKEKDANNVTLTEINKVPASTGIVVNAAAAGTYAIPVLTAAADATTGNLLKPWLTAGMPGDANYYTLAVDGGNPIFKKSSGGTLAAGKAYLVMSGTLAPELGVGFEGGITGINNVKGSEFNANDNIYNLNGQRVANPTKGLYIVNGKKVIVK